MSVFTLAVKANCYQVGGDALKKQNKQINKHKNAVASIKKKTKLVNNIFFAAISQVEALMLK